MSEWSDRLLFLKTWIRHPLTIGSVAPSAPSLVNRMLEPIQWDRIDTVVELGAGTGPVTAEIARRKPANVRFLAFEREPKFRELLQQRCPGVQLYPEASELCQVLSMTGRPQADVIVSGIPFTNLTAAQQERLLDQVEQALAPDGLFVAFQYSPLLYQRLRRRFVHCEVDVVLGNLPPALVFTCRLATATAG